MTTKLKKNPFITLSLVATLFAVATLALSANSAMADEAEGEDKQADSQKSSGEQKGYAEEAVKRYNRGVELHHSGFLNQAIQEYKAAIDADPKIAEAYSNLGAVYLAQRSYEKAQDAFTKALELKPNRPTTLNGLGNALYARGKTEEAKSKWKEAIAADPGFASAYYNMGNALESEKDSRGAIAEYMKAIGANPKMADAYFRVGTILSKEKHPAQANVFLTQAVAISPEADFVKEAKRMIATLQSELAKDAERPNEIEMNLHPPRREAATRDSDGSKKTEGEESKKVVAEPDRRGESSGGTQRPRWPFVRKKKEEKKVEMFVQPPESEDLKPVPKDENKSSDAWQ